MNLFDRTPDRHERTPEERRRAYAEREARRAARDGRLPDDAPPLPEPATASAQPVEPPEPAHEAASVAPPEAASPPEPVRPAEVAPEPVRPAEVAPEPVAPEPVAPREPVRPVEVAPEPVAPPEPVRPPEAAPTPQRARREPAFQAHRSPPTEPVTSPAPQQMPSAPSTGAVTTDARSSQQGPRADEAGQHDWPTVGGSAHDTGNGASGDRAWRPRLRPPRDPGTPGLTPTGRAGVGWGRRIAAGLAVVVVLAIAWFLFSLFQPLRGNGHGAVQVRIPSNVGVGEIGSTLAQRDIVTSSFFFSLRARLSGRSADLKPGRYTLKHGMSYGAAIDALVKGPQAPKTIDLTIPEGRSIEETAARLKAANIPLAGSYAAAARRSSVLSPRSYGAPRATATLEGFLWPATYNLAPGAPATKLVDQQVVAFRRNFANVDLRSARRKNLTPYDVITIASMIEGEARVERDRPLIAAVIYNRLRVGEPLAIDATIAYGTHKVGQPLTSADFQRPTPYNSYRHKGLPPTPIGNPGLASLQAAAHPAAVAYRYYVVNPRDLCRHVFTADYASFLRAQSAYSKAAAAGRVDTPKDCRGR